MSFSLKDGLAQAPGRIINRNPATNTQYSRSFALDGGPQIDVGTGLTGTNWSPYGWQRIHEYRVPMPMSLMGTRQARMFNASPNPWPANGTNDQPSAYFNLIRLKPTGSGSCSSVNLVMLRAKELALTSKLRMLLKPAAG